MSNRILVVEDDPSLREWVNFELNCEGYDVMLASDGTSVMDKIKPRHLPDLVLLDVQLPGCSGFEICKSLRQRHDTASIPVIFLTSRSTLNDKLSGFESGGTDYLPKPFTMAELKARIKAVLHQGQMARQQGEAIVEEEMAQAAAIQQGLMVRRIPTVPGLEIAARSVAAKSVGGDFYDFYALPNGQLCVAVADVSGKGLPAALMMTSARTAIRGAAHYMPSPEVTLSTVGGHLYDDLTEVSKFITAYLAFYEPESRGLAYSNAGHSVAILCRAGEPAQILEADGPPLGILTPFEYPGHTIDFQPGDMLAIVSDGLFEVFNRAGDMFGYERLLATVEGLAFEPAQSIADRLLEVVHEFAEGEEQADDQTLVILKGVEG